MNKPYAGIVCTYHGEVDIDKDEYIHQMGRPDARWKCPKCGGTSDFNDERYEELNPGEDAT